MILGLFNEINSAFMEQLLVKFILLYEKLLLTNCNEI